MPPESLLEGKSDIRRQEIIDAYQRRYGSIYLVSVATTCDVPIPDSAMWHEKNNNTWWALELDEFPIEGNKMGYIRGIQLVHLHTGELPDYLEPVKEKRDAERQKGK